MSPVIHIDISPFQTYYIPDTKTAEAGEQISPFYYLILHRCCYQRVNLLDGHILPLAFGTTNLVRIADFRKGIDFYHIGTHGSVQCVIQIINRVAVGERHARADLRDPKLQPSARGRLRAAAFPCGTTNEKFKIKN